MRNVKWLVAAGLVVAVTGCVETNGYPTTSYGGYPSYGGGYPSYGGGYPSTAYRPSSYYYGGSYPNVAYRYRDRNHNGIPDRYERTWW